MSVDLATYVEVSTARRAQEDRADDLLPAELTVAFGAGDAAVPGSVPLHDFMPTAGTLTHTERMVIADQAMLMLEGNYVHLRSSRRCTRSTRSSGCGCCGPACCARPTRRWSRSGPSTRRCRRSSTRCATCTPTTCSRSPSPGWSPICRSRWSVASRTAGSPTSSPGSRRACPHRRSPSASRARTGTGCRSSERWPSTPTGSPGATPAARLDRGVDSLTIRSLRLHLPPDEEWVTVSYLDRDGVRCELREPWLVASNAPAMADVEVLTEAAASQGLDLHADETSRACTPRAMQQTLGNLAIELSTDPAAIGADVPSTMPLVFRARSVPTATGTTGHRPPADLHLQRARPRRVRGRVRPAPSTPRRSRSARTPGPTPSASATSGPSCWSPTPAATPRPTSSRRASGGWT